MPCNQLLVHISGAVDLDIVLRPVFTREAPRGEDNATGKSEKSEVTTSVRTSCIITAEGNFFNDLHHYIGSK